MTWRCAKGATNRANADGLSKRAKLDHDNLGADKTGDERHEEHRARAGRDHDVGPFPEDDFHGLDEVASAGGQHPERRAQARLSQGHVGHEEGPVLLGNALSQSGVFGDEEVIVGRPNRREVEELAQVASARGGQANPGTGP